MARPPGRRPLRLVLPPRPRPHLIPALSPEHLTLVARGPGVELWATPGALILTVNLGRPVAGADLACTLTCPPAAAAAPSSTATTVAVGASDGPRVVVPLPPGVGKVTSTGAAAETAGDGRVTVRLPLVG